jgi:hypothetical protein
MKALYEKVPLGQVKPHGWYKDQLRLQASGVTGIIDKYWDPLKSNSGWLGGDGENWERGPYYLDGLLPLGWLLEDETLKKNAQKWIDWTLASQREDGFFGPPSNTDPWPRSVMIKCLVQYAEITGDKKVLRFILKYFKYFSEQLKKEGLHMWSWARGQEMILSVMWAYKHQPEQWISDLSEFVFNFSIDWMDYYLNFPYTRPISYYYDWETFTDKFGDELHKALWYHQSHGVNVAMSLKAIPLRAFFSGGIDPEAMFYQAISDIRKYHGTANGMFTCDEHLAGNEPTQGVELCTIVELMYSLEIFLPWTDKAYAADYIEWIAYNALPASMTEDLRGHQYLQQVNQILCSVAQRHWYNNRTDANTYGLEPHYGCCTANLHQGWPKLASAFWMRSPGGGIVASVYGPCTFTFETSDNKNCTVEEITDYPFSDTIKFSFSCEEEVCCPFKLRIPSWCKKAEIRLPDGRLLHPGPGIYFELGDLWHNGDEVTVQFSFELRLTHWVHDSVSVSYGPLVMALQLEEEWIKTKGEEPFPYWDVKTSSKWNYALYLSSNGTIPNPRIIHRKVNIQPCAAKDPPLIIEAPAKLVPEWVMEDHSAGKLPQSPVPPEICSSEIETIRLIPYGATRMRIGQFPYTL